jgi:1,4-alpha-glucan branching enzyme
LGFDSQWNATLGYYIRKDFPSTGAISMSDVIAGMTSNFNNSPLQSVIYVESQDELDQAGSRLYQLVDPQDPTSRTARKKACLAAALVFTTPGVPMVYQGDEFLDPSWADFKTMLTWSNAQTWAGIINLYGAVVRLRTNAGGTSPGLVDTDLNTYQQDKTNDVMVYDRYNKSSPGSDDVIVVVNLSATVFSGGYEIGLPYGGIWQVLFNSDSQTYSSDFGNVGPTGSVTASNAPYDGQPYSATIPIGDYSVIILSQK